MRIAPLPDYALPIWDWFNDIASKRDYGEVGPKQVTWSEINAWCKLTNTRLENWELKAIVALDAAFIQTWYEK